MILVTINFAVLTQKIDKKIILDRKKREENLSNKIEKLKKEEKK